MRGSGLCGESGGKSSGQSLCRRGEQGTALLRGCVGHAVTRNEDAEDSGHPTRRGDRRRERGDITLYPTLDDHETRSRRLATQDDSGGGSGPG